ncbi:hypothetical protein [Rhizobium leguminosarum]|uniref:hypothetical protein n=1 Tax=Rhizobium TaxID=379 RepID=UPI001FE0DA6C|nr:hypothetical protein [Rhizobium leguminosarum]
MIIDLIRMAAGIAMARRWPMGKCPVQLPVSMSDCLFNFDVDQSIPLSSTLSSYHWFNAQPLSEMIDIQPMVSSTMLTRSKASERHRRDPRLALVRS